ncbi:MAG: trifunctional dihydropteroate synthetase [Alectoria sarmentosa]|nr:MAG: trifunctional dihydropteroate synthetase [Alectoria sarmentosa]
MDTISLRKFHMTAVIGPDAWNRPGKSQPILLTLKLLIDTTSAGTSDEIAHTFSYGQMCKDATLLSDGHFRSIDELTTNLVGIALAKNWPGESLQISCVAPKALLRVEGGLGREVTLRKQWIGSQTTRQQIWGWERHAWLVKELKVACIIGVNPHERLEKQQVTINLEILGAQGKEGEDGKEQNGAGNAPWATLVSRVCSVVERSEFQTLEALAALIARTCLEDFPIPQVTVSIEKPSALTFVEGAGVEITRDRSFLNH